MMEDIASPIVVKSEPIYSSLYEEIDLLSSSSGAEDSDNNSPDQSDREDNNNDTELNKTILIDNDRVQEELKENPMNHSDATNSSSNPSQSGRVLNVIKPLWVHHNNHSSILSCSISVDNKRLATGGSDNNIFIWNFAAILEDKPKEGVLAELNQHGAPVNCVRFSPNNAYLASACDGNNATVAVWRLSQGSHSGNLSNFNEQGRGAAAENWSLYCQFRGHTSDIQDICWSPDSNYLASASVDNSIKIWCIVGDHSSCVATLNGHKSWVRGVAWDPQSKYLASSSEDGSLLIWSTSDWSIKRKITESFDSKSHLLKGGNLQRELVFSRLSWSADGSLLGASRGVTNGINVSPIFNRGTWHRKFLYVGHKSPTTATLFNPRLFTSLENGNSSVFTICAVCSQDSSLSIWSSNSAAPIILFKDCFNQAIVDCSWSSDGLTLICCSNNGDIALLQLNSAILKGRAMEEEEFAQWLNKMYNNQANFSTNFHNSSSGNQLLESTVNMQLKQAQIPANSPQKATEVPSAAASELAAPIVHKPLVRNQREIRTNQGKRRIVPTVSTQFTGETANSLQLPQNSSENERKDGSLSGGNEPEEREQPKRKDSELDERPQGKRPHHGRANDQEKGRAAIVIDFNNIIAAAPALDEQIVALRGAQNSGEEEELSIIVKDLPPALLASSAIISTRNLPIAANNSTLSLNSGQNSPQWQVILPGRIILAAATQHLIVVVATENSANRSNLYTLSRATGRILMPQIVLANLPVKLITTPSPRATGPAAAIAVITSDAEIHTFSEEIGCFPPLRSTGIISFRSLILSGKNSATPANSLHAARLLAGGNLLISLNNGEIYEFSRGLNHWVRLDQLNYFAAECKGGENSAGSSSADEETQQFLSSNSNKFQLNPLGLLSLSGELRIHQTLQHIENQLIRAQLQLRDSGSEIVSENYLYWARIYAEKLIQYSGSGAADSSSANSSRNTINLMARGRLFEFLSELISNNHVNNDYLGSLLALLNSNPSLQKFTQLLYTQIQSRTAQQQQQQQQ
jgi:WD40 repeat protein